MTTEGTLRFVRILHGALLVSMLLYAVIMYVVPSTTRDKPPLVEVEALAVIGVALICVAIWLRRKRIDAAFELLRTKPNDAGALQDWRQGAVLSATMAEALVLFSVALHFMGGSRVEVGGFWVAGVIAMLGWWPQQP